MTEENNSTPQNPAQEVLPAVIPVPIDSITEAVHNELKPEEMARMTRALFELTEHRESDPSRGSATKLLFDRLMSKEDPEQKRRAAEERNAAIADARCILAEFATHK